MAAIDGHRGITEVGRLAALAAVVLTPVACFSLGGDPSYDVWVENNQSEVVEVVYSDRSTETLDAFTYVVPAGSSRTIELAVSGQAFDVLDHSCKEIGHFQVQVGGWTQVVVDGGLELKQGGDGPSPNATPPPSAQTTRDCQQ